MTRKPKVGRPSLGDAARTKVVPIKLSQDEYDAIAAAAAKADTTVSAAIREPALAAAGFVFCRWCESRKHRWCCRACGKAIDRDVDTCSAKCRAEWETREDRAHDDLRRARDRV